jgi:hypothetical protein
MTNDPSLLPDWLHTAKARGWSGTLLTLLDVLEPAAPLIAQVLYVSTPAAGLFGQRRAWMQLAQALEEAEGLSALRAALGQPPDPNQEG